MKGPEKGQMILTHAALAELFIYVYTDILIQMIVRNG